MEVLQIDQKLYKLKEKLVNIKRFYNYENDEDPVRIHHAVITYDNVIYAAENDNMDRSGYLWECQLG